MANLKGITVIVTRPVNQSIKLTQLVNFADGECISCPTIEIESLLNEEDLREKWTELLPADGVIFISANAVRVGLKNLKAGVLSQHRVLAIGSATAQALQRKGLKHVLVPTDVFNSEALLKMPALNNIKDKHFIIVRGKGGRDHLELSLLQRGAHVHSLECYQRVTPTFNLETFKERVKIARNPVITFTSSTAARNFTQMTKDADALFADKLKHMPVIVFSERIRQFVENDLKYKGAVAVSPQPTDESMVSTIELFVATNAIVT